MKVPMTKNPGQVRQGDVFVERVETPLPKSKKNRKENGRAIFAHGEVTGHAHEVDNPKTTRVFEPAKEISLPGDLADQRGLARVAAKLGRPAKLKHQEHAPIARDKGGYRVTIQREYTPAEIRSVKD